MKSKALHLIMAWKMSNVRESEALTRLYFKLSQCRGLKLSPTCVVSTTCPEGQGIYTMYRCAITNDSCRRSWSEAA